MPMMFRLTTLLLSLTLLTGCAGPSVLTAPAEFALSPTTASKGNVLVVMSAAHRIDLKNGASHPTGYFLSELVEPVERLLAAGYEVTFASPGGLAPTLDLDSLHRLYWLSSSKREAALRRMLASEKLRNPVPLEAVVSADYTGLFVPGGHAPMVDLARSATLGRILRAFHAAGKPTGVLCHGPAALLAALPHRDEAGRPWPYRGYRMAIFTKLEERVSETFFLGGEVPYLIDEKLAEAGGVLDTSFVNPISPGHAIRDRELITGQNPYSAEPFAEVLVEALDEYRRTGSLIPPAGVSLTRAR